MKKILLSVLVCIACAQLATAQSSQKIVLATKEPLAGKKLERKAKTGNPTSLDRKKADRFLMPVESMEPVQKKKGRQKN